MSNEIESGTVDPQNPTYARMTDARVDELAKGCYRNEIFASWMMSPFDQESLLTMVFMPLMFLDDIARRQMEVDQIAHVYADMKDAGPRGVNGFPIFMACSMCNQEDANRIIDRIIEIQKLLGDK